MNRPISVGILLFNEIEVLDFAGPFEVFSLATLPGTEERAFHVSTVSQHGNLIKAYNDLQVQPEYSFETAPPFDILVVPGGYGARVLELHNQELLCWIKSCYETVELLASVCTGAFLLAEAGLLEGRAATTHWGSADQFEKDYPQVEVRHDVKFVDQGKVITSGGISAGINMSFYIVRKLIGRESAIATAKRMEYDIVI
jgi:transcriptional regulator GlxA family with amidase domain